VTVQVAGCEVVLIVVANQFDLNYFATKLRHGVNITNTDNHMSPSHIVPAYSSLQLKT